MFTVDDNLKVVVHPEVESDYLKQYNNKSLYIPENFKVEIIRTCKKVFTKQQSIWKHFSEICF